MQHSPSHPWIKLKDLILVAGHAIFRNLPDQTPTEDQNWILQEFQRGEPFYYLEQLQAGIKLAADNPESLLLFSGGQTRKEAGPLSEAQSYWNLAEKMEWFQFPEVSARTTTEEFARDSFENLLFSISRFFECTQKFPETIQIVSWKFKETRFQFHRKTIRWPAARLQFRGVCNPKEIAKARISEQKVLKAFQQDPYGVLSEELTRKRVERNPFNRNAPYLLSCPTLKSLLQHSGPDFFSEPLPWN